MHTVKSLTFIFLFSLLLMSHLYKEFSCESVVHKVDNGQEDIFDQKQLPDMTKGDSKHEILSRLGLSREPLPKVYITGRHSAGQQPAGSECQRHNMYVNFTQLGWQTWLIAPSGYNAYYCAGKCSLAQTMVLDSTKHSYIQSIMNGYNSQIPKPCCVPTKLSSLQVLYSANSSIHNEQWTEMIVEACGCL